MKNQEEFKRLIRMAFGLSLLFVHGVLFWYMWRRYYSPLMETEYWRRGHWLMLAFSGAMSFPGFTEDGRSVI